MKTDKKICIVAGASSGIGFAIAKALADDGQYHIIVTARREEKLNELKAENVDIQTGDMNDTKFQNHLVNSVFEKYYRCDYLFNSAGMLEVGSIEEIDIEKMCSMLRLNIESTFRLSYILLKRFKQQGFGHIINISSVMGTKVRPTNGAYAATKFAMEALSESLRLELSESDIQVSCIEPGLVMTELHKDWETHPKESLCIEKPLSPEDIVESVKYILAQPSHVRIPKLMILPKGHVI